MTVVTVVTLSTVVTVVTVGTIVTEVTKKNCQETLQKNKYKNSFYFFFYKKKQNIFTKISKTQIAMKLNNSNCDKTQKLIVRKLTLIYGN